MRRTRSRLVALLAVAGVLLASQAFAADRAGFVVGNLVLTRTQLRPSLVRADATVTEGGAPILPTGVACTASFADDKGYATRRYEGQFKRGLVRCNFVFNNARYLGKTLVGEITVSTGSAGNTGARITKKFSVRIGAGNTLGNTVGATVERGPAPPLRSSSAWRGTVHLVHVHGGPGQPGWNTSLDLQLTLLPGATKTGLLSWSQPVAWIARYASEFYANTPCTDPSGRTVPNRMEERTTIRGRTGDPTSSYPKSATFKENAHIVVRWDTRQSQWVVGFNGTRPRRYVEKTTNDCGRTWKAQTGIGPGLPSYTIRIDGTATSMVLKGEGRPVGVIESDNATATWDLTLAPAK